MHSFTGTLVLACAAGAFAAPEPLEKRQNLTELLELASLAGITQLPTDPAVLLSLGPVANELASALPTAPVLSVLETAAPSGFLSEILHNPTFASSFESAFAAGSSPTWFNSLPTAVKSYLHTYSGFAGLATAAAAIDSLSANETVGGTTGSGTSATSSISITGSTSSATGPAGANSASTSTPTSSTSQAGAPRPTGALAAGLLGAVGILGIAVAL